MCTSPLCYSTSTPDATNFQLSKEAWAAGGVTKCNGFLIPNVIINRANTTALPSLLKSYKRLQVFRSLHKYWGSRETAAPRGED
jgi:hypothetical protein